LLRRDALSPEGDHWTELSIFSDASKAAEALDEAAASGEGELDDYRIDERTPASKHWFQPSTWLSFNHASP
jgi:hypothetical protein